jgi:ABC-2 type transport system permease protein
MITHKVVAVLKKDALTALRHRNGFVLTAIAQVAQLSMFYYLSRAVGPQYRPDGMPYFLFLLVGAGFYTFLLAGTHSFLQSIQESQRTGTLEVLMTTSTPAPVLVALGALSAFAVGFLQLLISVACGFFLVSAPLRVHVFGCAVVFVFSVLIAFAFGLFAAGLQIAIHKGSAVLWFLGSCAWLMSGTLFPAAVLPRPVQALSYLLPFTHSLNGMRLALLAESGSALTHEMQVLAVFALFLVPAGVTFFSCTVRHARRGGTLSFY